MNREFEQLLEQEALGELDAAGRIRLETLSAANPAFTQRLGQERRLTRMLGQYGPNRAPAGLARGVFAELDNPTKSQSFKPSPRVWWTNPLLGWGACAAVLAVILIRPLLTDDTATPNPTQPMANIVTNGFADHARERRVAKAETPADAPFAFNAAAESEKADADAEGALLAAAPASASTQHDQAPLAKPELPAREAFAPAHAAGEERAVTERLGQDADRHALERASTPAELAKARLKREFEEAQSHPSDPKPQPEASPVMGMLASSAEPVADAQAAVRARAPQRRVGLRITLASASGAQINLPRTQNTRPLRQSAPQGPAAVRHSLTGSIERLENTDLPTYSQKDIEIAVLMAGGKIVKRQGLPGEGQTSQISVIMNPEQMRVFLKTLNEMGIRAKDMAAADKKKSVVPAKVLSPQYEVTEGEAIYRMVEKGAPVEPTPAEAPGTGESLDLATPARADGGIDLSLTIQRAED